MDKHTQLAAMSEAGALPAPGPLAAALTATPRTIGPWTLRPFTYMDWVILQMLGSPLIQYLTRAGQEESAPRGDITVDVIEAIYLLTRPARESLALFARGRETYRIQALQTVLETPGYDPVTVNEASAHICESMVAALQTLISHRAPKVEGEEVFTPPGSSRTASAGSGKE
jgi:hypothetical protein